MSDLLEIYGNKCKREVAMMKFLAENSDQWHSFAADRETVELVCAFVNRGDCRINERKQVKATKQLIRKVQLLR